MSNKWELNFVVKKVSQETNSKFADLSTCIYYPKQIKKSKSKQFFEVGAKIFPLALKDHFSLCCREVLLSCPFWLQNRRFVFVKIIQLKLITKNNLNQVSQSHNGKGCKGPQWVMWSDLPA